MRLAGFGRIVNVASTAALRGYRFTAAYVASKHALLGLTRALAEDLRDTGVTVNAVCPGFLDTPMTARTVARIVEATGCSADEARQKLAAANASGRLIAPDEVAHAIVELVGDPEAHGEARVLG
jgi:NAD(P)-dependent dehydrogenase (short-subunit alcohol dehydrogenase family)